MKTHQNFNEISTNTNGILISVSTVILLKIAVKFYQIFSEIPENVAEISIISFRSIILYIQI